MVCAHEEGCSLAALSSPMTGLSLVDATFVVCSMRATKRLASGCDSHGAAVRASRASKAARRYQSAGQIGRAGRRSWQYVSQ